MHNNSLSGKIPSSLGNLSLLFSLDLSDNYLTGPIPSSIGRLSQLLNLLLDSNQLTGIIPSEIGNLKFLLGLFLNNNKLSGSIPPTIWKMNQLKSLVLGNNQLIGEIPFFVRLPEITLLNVANNNMTGFIPAIFFLSIPTLVFLTVEGNKHMKDDLDMKDDVFLVPNEERILYDNGIFFCQGI